MASDENQMEVTEALKILYEADAASEQYRSARQILERSLELDLPVPVPKPTPRRSPKFLTIGMATYNDFDGCYFTIQSIQCHHPEILNDVEFIIVDNNPASHFGKATKAMETVGSNVRYIPFRSVQSSAAKEVVFREASGEWVLCVDSHVLFPLGELARLIDYCRSHPGSKDLLTGPRLIDDMKVLSTHLEPAWCGPMYGRWSYDPRGAESDAPPFEIPMAGIGVFACRRAAWPGFNPRFAGYGGEEGYIHEKIRRAGGRNLCLPFLRWLHRDQRPHGIPYRMHPDDKIRNYLLAHDELGNDPAPAIAALTDWEVKQGLGLEATQEMVRAAQAEIESPFHFFDGIYCLNSDREPQRWEAARLGLQELAIDRKVRRFAAAETPADPRIGHVLSHRRVVAEAKLLRLNAVLVFDDDLHWSSNAAGVVGRTLDELKEENWDLLFLGTPPCTHAIVYHSRAYDQILSAIPEHAIDVGLWLRDHTDLGHFLAQEFRGATFETVSPIVTFGAGELRLEKPAVTNSEVLGIDGLLDLLEKADPASEFYRGAAKIADSRLMNGQPPPPAPAPRGPKKFLTIGMATSDDYDGVYFSVQAIRAFHPEITEETEILVIDNNPGGPCSAPLINLGPWVTGYRYVPFGNRSGTATRDIVFRESNSEYVLVMDSHVMFPSGSLARLISFLKGQSESRDLWQGPLVYDDLRSISTHFRPMWSHGMYGVWDTDERGKDPNTPPFEIAMQGLGVFVCRKDAWVGFNPRLRGFGGEEGFIHEKIRQNGGTVFCLPFLRWIHRFERPFGTRYSNAWEDRIRNYLIEHDELGLDPTPAIEHFEKFLGVEQARPLIEAAQREIAGPFHFFDAIYCINLESRKDRWESVTRQFEELGIAGKLQRFPGIETPADHHIGDALSHRAIIAEAKKYGFRNVLVFEDDVVFDPEVLECFTRNIRELKESWQEPVHLMCAHAIGYHESIYDRILSETPDTPTGVALWLRKQAGISRSSIEVEA